MKFGPIRNTKADRYIRYDELASQTEHLGSGLFAAVYAHPTEPGRVIKVSRMRNSPKHDPYLRYLHKTSRRNVHRPRVSEVRVLRYQPNAQYSEMYCEVHMERLIPWSLAPDEAQEAALKLFGVNYLYDIGRQYQGKCLSKQAQEISDVIYKLTVNEWYTNDIAEQNVMFREEDGKYTLVITDPCC